MAALFEHNTIESNFCGEKKTCAWSRPTTSLLCVSSWGSHAVYPCHELWLHHELFLRLDRCLGRLAQRHARSGDMVDWPPAPVCVCVCVCVRACVRVRACGVTWGDRQASSTLTAAGVVVSDVAVCLTSARGGEGRGGEGMVVSCPCSIMFPSTLRSGLTPVCMMYV